MWRDTCVYIGTHLDITYLSTLSAADPERSYPSHCTLLPLSDLYLPTKKAGGNSHSEQAETGRTRHREIHSSHFISVNLRGRLPPVFRNRWSVSQRRLTLTYTVLTKEWLTYSCVGVKISTHRLTKKIAKSGCRTCFPHKMVIRCSEVIDGWDIPGKLWLSWFFHAGWGSYPFHVFFFNGKTNVSF